jgi:hypothetical protein
MTQTDNNSLPRRQHYYDSIDRATTYSKFTLSTLFGANHELVLAEFSANGRGLGSVLETWQVGGPLGALFGFDEKVDELFTYTRSIDSGQG